MKTLEKEKIEEEQLDELQKVLQNIGFSKDLVYPKKDQNEFLKYMENFQKF